MNLVRRWLWLPLLGLLVGALSGALAASGHESTYEAESTLVIGPAPTLTDPREIADSLDTLDRRSVVATFAALPSSRTVRQLAQRRLGISEAQIADYVVTARVVPDSNVVSVAVEGPDAALTAQLANELALQTIAIARDFYTIYSVRVLDAAQLPQVEASSGAGRAVLLGGLLGLLIGLGAAFLLDRRTRGPHETSARVRLRGAADESPR